MTRDAGGGAIVGAAGQGAVASATAVAANSTSGGAPALASALGPDSAADTVQHRAKRARRLGLAVVTSLATRPLSFVIPLLTLPLFIGYLGKERFGLYDSIGALTLWLALTNAGLGMGLLNRLQDCYVSGDTTRARRYVSSMWIALVGIALAGMLVVTAIVPFVQWQVVFKTSTPHAARGTALAVWVAAAVMLANVAISVPTVAQMAYQEMHLLNLWEGAARLATLAACVTVIFLPVSSTVFGLSVVILASSGVPVLVRLVNAMWQMHRRPWLRPSWSHFDRSELRQMLSEGTWMFVLQLATIMVFEVDKLIISNRLGAAQVTPYTLVGRVFLIVYGMYGLVMYPLWPAYGEAMRRGDLSWVRRAVSIMRIVGVGSMLLCGAGLFFFGQPIFRLLAQTQDVAVPESLVVAMTAMFAMRALAESQSIPLNAAGVIRPQLPILLGNGILNVIVAVMLARPYGVVGVAWAFPLTAVVTTLWGYPWLVRKYLGSSSRPAAPDAGPMARVQGVVE